MSWLYKHVLRPSMFRLPAETAHELAAWGLGLAHRHTLVRAMIQSPPPDPCLRVNALGRTFRSPLCLAAGFDKRGSMYNALGALGFAAVEVGTVTAHAQVGNPRPRLFRVPADRALVNRMGFNNPGALEMSRALARYAPDDVVLGVNLGKSKVTPNEQAADDYAQSARLLAPFAHYLVVNVSSPNTPGLRALQSVEALAPVLRAVRTASESVSPRPPLLVKIAPDLADEDVDAVAELAMSLGLDGVVACNTTIARTGLVTDAHTVQALGAGGLSGPVLRPRMLEVIARLRARTKGALTLVAAGGMHTADHVWEALSAGASLVQVYTGFIYEGPSMARDIHNALAARVKREGLGSIEALSAGATTRP